MRGLDHHPTRVALEPSRLTSNKPLVSFWKAVRGILWIRNPDAPTPLRLRLLGEYARAISEQEQRDEEICCEMAKLVNADRLHARPALRHLDAFCSRAAGRGAWPAPVHGL